MKSAAILVTGTARYSLGECFVIRYCSKYRNSPILALDQQLNPKLKRFGGIYATQINLNPLDHPAGFTSFADELKRTLEEGLSLLSRDAISTAVLSAGLYSAGSLIKHTTLIRKALLGVNVCGKLEILHSVLSLNQERRFDNRKYFTLVDIGSTHGLCPKRGRSLYALSKAMGLALCIALQDGTEVRRYIHLAPGPIDTPMLHRNYWILKERGPARFLNFLWSYHKDLYYQVFVKCDDYAVQEACSQQGKDPDVIKKAFVRYKKRRESQLETNEGILKSGDVSKLLIRILKDERSYLPGVYVVTAPKGRMKVEFLPFSEFRYCIERL